VADCNLLDTGIVIEYLRGSTQAADYLQGLSGEWLLSAISVAELWSGAKGMEEERSLDQFLLAFRIISVDEEIAKEGGILRSEYASSHGTRLADAIIAATALREGARLISFNAKHYPMIEDIQIPYHR
jgi:predicted nucleic acid-binding protein